MGAPGGGVKGREDSREAFRGLMHELLFATASSLKLLGGLLLLLVPSSLLAYGLLSLPLPPLRHVGLASQCLERCLGFLEWFALPALLGAARVLGISREEALGEDLDEPEFARRTKRVLLGLLALNVASSFLAVIALGALVLTVRTSGILDE